MPKTKSYDGLHCPKCGGDMMRLGDFDNSSNTQVFVEVMCQNPDCQTRYNETYTLSSLFEQDDEGHEVQRFPIRR